MLLEKQQLDTHGLQILDALIDTVFFLRMEGKAIHH